MEKEAIAFRVERAPQYGQIVYEKKFPSEVCLIPAVIIRLVEFLTQEGLLGEDRKNQLSLCFDEALKNAVLHGNRSNAELLCSVRIELCPEDYWVVISDQGPGFDLDEVPDPLDKSGLWRDGGRGIHLMQHYSKAIAYWDGGRTLALCFGRNDLEG